MPKQQLEMLQELSKKGTRGKWANRQVLLMDGDLDLAAALVDWFRTGGYDLALDGLKWREMQEDISSIRAHFLD